MSKGLRQTLIAIAIGVVVGIPLNWIFPPLGGLILFAIVAFAIVAIRLWINIHRPRLFCLDCHKNFSSVDGLFDHGIKSHHSVAAYNAAFGTIRTKFEDD